MANCISITSSSSSSSDERDSDVVLLGGSRGNVSDSEFEGGTAGIICIFLHFY